MKNILSVLLLLLIHQSLLAQQSAYFLSEEDLMQIVLKYHPIAKQAEINVTAADAGILKARGAFDPVIQMGASKKNLNEIIYYNYNAAEVKIPTWYGIELGAGIEQVNGLRTDPQETPGVSNFAGITVPILKNLVTDKRRAALQQAKTMVQQSEMERLSILNDLLYEALTNYWQWVLSYKKLIIIDRVVKVAQQRVEYTKQTIELGERPAIDSVEAITQLQYFLYLLNETQVEVQNGLIQLSTYTWNDKGTPYELPSALAPDKTNFEVPKISYDVRTEQEYIDYMLNQHPDLRQYQYKFKILDINKKLKFQEMLPTLNAKYNFINKGNSFLSGAGSSFLQNNYQYGLSFYMPLRLSEARAEYKLANLKIDQTKNAFDLKRLGLTNKVKEYYNQLKLLQQQIELQQALLKNQTELLSGEETRFMNGESSMFMINNREQKQIETEQKLVETIAKYYKQKAAMKWVSGMLAN